MKVKNNSIKLINRRLLIQLSLIAILFLGNEFSRVYADEKQTEPKIIIIGNSITFHESKPSIGWHFEHGMAAGSKDKDYVQKLLKSLEIKEKDAVVKNLHQYENNPIDPARMIEWLGEVSAINLEFAVIQLGDNVPFNRDNLISSAHTALRFAKNYYKLIGKILSINPKSKVYCLSTWWGNPLADFIIKGGCYFKGQNYIYIGDLYSNELNTDRLHVSFENYGVDMHPKDWGMDMISKRLISAIKRND